MAERDVFWLCYFDIFGRVPKADASAKTRTETNMAQVTSGRPTPPISDPAAVLATAQIPVVHGSLCSNIGKPDRQARASKPEKVLCNGSLDVMQDRQLKLIETSGRFALAILEWPLVVLSVEVDRATENLPGRFPVAPRPCSRSSDPVVRGR